MAKACQSQAIVSRNFTWSAAKFCCYSIVKLNHLTYWSTKNWWCQPHFLVFNKIQNIRKHNFETDKRLIFDYAFFISSILQTQLEAHPRLTANFEVLGSPYFTEFLLIFRKQFSYFSLLDELQGRQVCVLTVNYKHSVNALNLFNVSSLRLKTG